MKTRLWLCGFLAALLFPIGGHAYEAVKVTNGGTIIGVAVLSDSIPKPAPLQIPKDQPFCPGAIESEVLLLGEAGGLRNVVVKIVNILKGKAADTTARPALDNRDCRFEPHVQTAIVGQKLAITNSDPVLHNTHAYIDGKRTAFNLALPFQGMTIKKTLRKAGRMELKCDAGHTWMSAYILVTDHPYAVTTGDHSFFTLGDIPPGKYTLEAWHETLGTRTIDVEVLAGDTTEVKFEFSASKTGGSDRAE